jgi:hypothetical protein
MFSKLTIASDALHRGPKCASRASPENLQQANDRVKRRFFPQK